MTDDDPELLRRYAENHDEAAFAKLVSRYLNLVYFAALRQVGQDAHCAEDVTQAVFTQLARKAGSLTRHPAVAAWLHTTTRFTANEILRTERRRLAREQEAQAMEVHSNDQYAIDNWEQLRPVIDEALEELNPRDREVVLLRFFANLPHAQIGQTLNLSENTARMRVDRALEKLHVSLRKRGVTSTAAALSTVLANQAFASAPVSLATAVSHAALASAAKDAVTTAATAKIISFMSTTKIALSAAGIISIAATAAALHQWQANTALHSENAVLRQQTSALRAENEQLASSKKSSEEIVRREQAELLRLRAADVLNNQSLSSHGDERAASARHDGPVASAPALSDKLSVDLAAKNKGRATPQDAARTLLWYLQGGDIKHAADLLSFEPAEKDKLKDFIDTLPADVQDKYGTPAKLMAFAMAGSPKPLANVQLLSETQPDDYTTIQKVRLEYKNGEIREDDLKFHRDVDGWKQVVSPASVDRVINYLKKK